MGKRKLGQFEELNTFENVLQPSLEEVIDNDYRLKGKWATGHFNNNKPIILELGCGKGEYTVGLAGLFPGQNFIGIDIKGARIWSGARQALNEDIHNVAFIRTRIEFINSVFAKDEVDEIWLTFPDPQLKSRRVKKRLTASKFLNSYRKILKDGGIIHLKTDNAVLYQYTLDLIKKNELPLLFAKENLLGSEMSDVVYGIHTFYEMKFIEKELPIHYLKFELPSDKIIKEP